LLIMPPPKLKGQAAIEALEIEMDYQQRFLARTKEKTIDKEEYESRLERVSPILVKFELALLQVQQPAKETAADEDFEEADEFRDRFYRIFNEFKRRIAKVIIHLK
jgi:excinuclease UvrABC nuclease subunit